VAKFATKVGVLREEFWFWLQHFRKVETSFAYLHFLWSECWSTVQEISNWDHRFTKQWRNEINISHFICSGILESVPPLQQFPWLYGHAIALMSLLGSTYIFEKMF